MFNKETNSFTKVYSGLHSTCVKTVMYFVTTIKNKSMEDGLTMMTKLEAEAASPLTI